MAASYFDDDFGENDHDLSMDEDDETIMFLSQHEKDDYDASTAYSTTEATASMMDAFDMILVLGNSQPTDLTPTDVSIANTQQIQRLPRVSPLAATDDFFDESYVAGRIASSTLKADMTRFINLSSRRSLTYADVFTADVTTLAEINAHEERIYQTDYTPKTIRNNILRLLTTTAKTAPMVNFQVKDIPPKRYDAITHESLQSLAETRKHFDPSDQRHNLINREMYRVYAASAYIVHTTTSCHIVSPRYVIYLLKLLSS
jgi:hypothetical protein